MTEQEEANQLTSQVETKITTLSELVKKIQEAPNDNDLVNDVRRFKIMMVKKSFSDIFQIIQAREVVQNTLVQKINEDITIYPINVLLDILKALDQIADRSMSIIESILPKSDDLNKFLEATKTLNIFNQAINMDGLSAASLNKVSRLVEAFMTQLDKVALSNVVEEVKSEEDPNGSPSED